MSIVLHVNRLNSVKRQSLSDSIKKTTSDNMLSTLRRTLDFKGLLDLKVKRRKKICHANNRNNKAGVAMLILDKRDFKIKNDRDKHFSFSN